MESIAHYAEALDKFSLALTVAPADKELVAQFGRLNFVGRQIKVLPDYKTDPFQAALHEGLLAYLAGKDLDAVQKVSQAQALRPDDHDIDTFLSQLELVTGIKRMKALATQGPEYAVAALMARANSAVRERRFDEAVELSLEVVKQDLSNGEAWQNLGTAYFALRDLDSSLRAWQKAYELEKSPGLRAAIREYIKAIGRAKTKRPTVAAARPLPARPQMTIQEKQDLFKEGVDHYTRREFGEAKKAFETILESYPDDAEAGNALNRVKEELP